MAIYSPQGVHTSYLQLSKKKHAALTLLAHLHMFFFFQLEAHHLEALHLEAHLSTNVSLHLEAHLSTNVSHNNANNLPLGELCTSN
jgi:hypothetical protein